MSLPTPPTSSSPSTSSSRFTPLSTHYLVSQPPDSETTLTSLIERSEQLAEEAREALPYSFDECTYSKGNLRQSVWSCIDCGEKGVCYGCSISCHAEHKLVELWTKRRFQCDCPTTSMPAFISNKRRRCTLNPPEAQPQPPNEENRYTRNFSGVFCRCGRDYDPETEVEAMLNCMGCEDWFHESCLNLRPQLATTPNPTTDDPGVGEEGEDEDEDEERQVLIRSETYDGLVCGDCIKSHPFLSEKAGTDGWMMIEPTCSGTWTVVGQKPPPHNGDQVKEELEKGQNDKSVDDETGEQRDIPADPCIEKLETKIEHGTDKKRPAENDMTNREEKKQRLASPSATHLSNGVSHEWKWKGKGDVFLSFGIRDQLKTALSAETIASLPFPLDDEEIYEPPKDEDEEETLEDVTNRVVGSLPRVQAIEALHGYQTMKDRLREMLAGHASQGRTVSKEDIEGFFEDLRATTG